MKGRTRRDGDFDLVSPGLVGSQKRETAALKKPDVVAAAQTGDPARFPPV